MKRGPFQIAVAFDQLVNALTWGSARQTISERTGQALARGKRWAKWAAPIIDFIMRGENHCRKAWEESQRPTQGAKSDAY